MSQNPERDWSHRMGVRLNSYLCKSHYAEKYKKLWEEGAYPFNSKDWQRYRDYLEAAKESFNNMRQ